LGKLQTNILSFKKSMGNKVYGKHNYVSDTAALLAAPL